MAGVRRRSAKFGQVISETSDIPPNALLALTWDTLLFVEAVFPRRSGCLMQPTDSPKRFSTACSIRVPSLYVAKASFTGLRSQRSVCAANIAAAAALMSLIRTCRRNVIDNVISITPAAFDLCCRFIRFPSNLRKTDFVKKPDFVKREWLS